MIILDTSIVIEYLKGNDKIIEVVNKYSRDSTTGITYISLYELLKYSNKQKSALNELIGTIKVVYPDETSASRSAEIFRKLKNSGNLINENDILIAGIALKNDNKFITLDSDFSMIKNTNIIVLEI
jgi:tRNA(fMet)-specific endonuclease VapC